MVYSSDRDGQGNLDIYMQQIGGGDPLPLTSNDDDDSQPSLSADGNLIVFRSRRDGGGIYVIPALGGAARRIADWGNNPRFSPDGSFVSFWREETDNTLQIFHHAWVVSASGGEARQVETNLGIAHPAAWSPDGKYLLVVGSENVREWGIRVPIDWWLVPVEGGSGVNLEARSLFNALGLDTDVLWDQFPTPGEWSPEGDWVIFRARLRDGGAANLWRVGVSADAGRLLGKPQRLTSGTGETAPSASRNGRIAFASETEDWDIWSLPLDANRGAVTGELELVVSGLSTDRFPSVSADGRRLVYTSDRSGKNDIWLRDLETGQDSQVTVGQDWESRGVISPDGSQVVFHRLVDGRRNVYLTEIGRGTEKLLLEDIGSHMDWTADGKKILYYTNAPVHYKTIDVATGEQQEVWPETDQVPPIDLRFSPSQEWLAFWVWGNGWSFVSPVKGGKGLAENEWTRLDEFQGRDFSHPWWSPDGNMLYHLSRRDGFKCIWVQRLNPATKAAQGPPMEVRHLHNRLRYSESGGAGFGYAMTPDTLYLPLAEAKSNLWLAEPVSE